MDWAFSWQEAHPVSTTVGAPSGPRPRKPASPSASNPHTPRPSAGRTRRDALDVLRKLPDESVSLIVTSPPFALIRQKAYGNVSHGDYIEWFWPFAEEIHRVLRPEGSFVLEIGGAWNSGSRDPWSSASARCSTWRTYWFNPSACRRRPSG